MGRTKSSAHPHVASATPRRVALDAEDVRTIQLALLHAVDAYRHDRSVTARLCRIYRRVSRLRDGGPAILSNGG